MQYVKLTVLSIALIMPGLAYGKGFNPFHHSSDSAPTFSPTQATTNSSTSSVPEPATALSVAAGLLGLAAWRRYRQP